MGRNNLKPINQTKLNFSLISLYSTFQAISILKENNFLGLADRLSKIDC